ncbi:MAG: 1,4-alpha-glucan branching enzyme, partial [Elusimicrobiota bacterium]|nr:1,4-alpha-glucan branching enzyme [Elusimicrobiota bacterium]
MERILENSVRQFSLLTSDDIYLFKNGNHFRLYEKLGAHIVDNDGKQGVYFCVYAPNAGSVSITGNFNLWDKNSHQLYSRGGNSGIWEGFIEGVKAGDCYQYFIISDFCNYNQKKADPFAFYCNSVDEDGAAISTVWDLSYDWKDNKWTKDRKQKKAASPPVSIYEVHLSSWLHSQDNKILSYEELASRLAHYCAQMGFTHVELMSLTDPLGAQELNQQSAGSFAPNSKHGAPQGLMALIDALHQANLAVILDWTCANFPVEASGLGRFDGTPLYENAGSSDNQADKMTAFDFSKNEVCNFLISNA